MSDHQFQEHSAGKEGAAPPLAVEQSPDGEAWGLAREREMQQRLEAQREGDGEGEAATVVNTPSKGGSETGQSGSRSPSYKAGRSAEAEPEPNSGDGAIAQEAELVAGTEVKGDTIWVDFPAGDPEDPFNFSSARKWIITILAVFFTAEVAATASAYVPGIAQMEEDLNVTNHELGLLGISIYALGFGIPPLALAPFSEVYGRKSVYLASHLAYTLFFLCCGFAPNMTTMLLGRFFGGAFGSTGSTLVGGTLADIWRTKERGFPMVSSASGGQTFLVFL
jgi:hypothetical protein